MSKRSQEKRTNIEAETIRFLRSQAKLSLREAERASGVGHGVIAHIEQGRIRLGKKHLEKLLPAFEINEKNVSYVRLR
jgi:transcriptional regulator with XRE-family HTH domain